MYGNLLSREIVTQLVRERMLTIEKFDSQQFGTAHYPIYISQYAWSNNGKINLHDFTLKGNDKLEVMPNQYGKVKIKNNIKVTEGIIGYFTPSSVLIESGLMLTAGKLDHGYEGDIWFGLYNASSEKITLSVNMRIAYVSFYDLRGVSNSIGKYYDEYLREIGRQRALDNYLKEKFNADFTNAGRE